MTGLFYSAYFKVQIAKCASSLFLPIAKQYPSGVLASFSSVGIWIISTPTPTLSPWRTDEPTWPVTLHTSSPRHPPNNPHPCASVQIGHHSPPHPPSDAHSFPGLLSWCQGTLVSTPVQPALQTTAESRVTPSKGSIIPMAPTAQEPSCFPESLYLLM